MLRPIAHSAGVVPSFLLAKTNEASGRSTLVAAAVEIITFGESISSAFLIYPSKIEVTSTVNPVVTRSPKVNRYFVAGRNTAVVHEI